jgi:hypothetical protein
MKKQCVSHEIKASLVNIVCMNVLVSVSAAGNLELDFLTLNIYYVGHCPLSGVDLV